MAAAHGSTAKQFRAFMISRLPAAAPEKPRLSNFVGRHADLLDQLLAEQQTLTAVERFAAYHETPIADGAPLQARYYQDLLPLQQPAPGEQFAFEVNLDRCSGCKACVTACHNLNGLDEGETWRQVGVLQDPSQRRTQQTVTTACHHCLEPGCAQGCPTLAYEKEAVTGVVRHLDDQCFGCQYCILKCPYDVPQYSKSKGIVRKCDLCVGRLRAGEAPACAQACPTRAIRIVLVTAQTIRNDPRAGLDLPGTPDSTYTLPTTRYVSATAIPDTLTPVDVHQVKAEPPHLPLVFLLVASQTAIGYWAFLALALVFGVGAASPDSLAPRLARLETLGLGLTLLTLALGPLHLGRPWLAWKAFLNWRRSWLSREILGFTIWAGAATVSTGLRWAGGDLRWASTTVWLTALAGAAALYASAMVYRDTPRVLWATRLTLVRFTLSATLCGGAAYALAGGRPSAVWIWGTLPAALIAKLWLETRVLRHLKDTDPNPLQKAARLLTGPLRLLWRSRVAAGLLGGVAAPVFLAAHPAPWGGWLVMILILAGELMERRLFFSTAVAPRMPGGR